MMNTPTPPPHAHAPPYSARRALADGLTLVGVGAAAGATGAVADPRVGLALGTVAGLGGGLWATTRVGVAGFVAGLIGLVTAVGGSLEIHRVSVTRTATVVELPSLAVWDPAGDVVAVRAGPLVHRRDLEVRVSYRGAGKPSQRTTRTEVLTPLYSPTEARVVGFHCRNDHDPVRDDGVIALSSAAWSGSMAPTCGRAMDRVHAAIAAAGVPVAAGAEQRLVEVFVSEDDLRSDGDIGGMFAVTTTLSIAYAAGVLWTRHRRR